ncbi:MAG TPA: endonuclease/exonuclease/phosphatase family protein [Actinomycetota bacterium]
MRRKQSRRRTGRISASLLCLVLVAGLVPAASAERQGSAARPPVKVMTRNLYFGADLLPATAARTVPELMAAVAGIWSEVRYTDFPARAKVLAREIADSAPALIALQEAPIWLSGPLLDPAPATDVEYDFLEILRTELAAIGAPYDVVRAQPESDIEAPAGAPYFKDIRLFDRDAILVRAGLGDEVRLSNAQSGTFVTLLPLPAGGRLFVSRRGWVSVDAVVSGRSFRFVDTHLEAFQPIVRAAQAVELLAGPILGAPGGRVVLAGDLNSGPELPALQDRLAFGVLRAFGLVDTWAVAHPGDPGYTSNFGPRLDEATLESRIDHVMTLGGIQVAGSEVTGTNPAHKTPSGLWPSDHAGVVATLVP